MQKRSRLCRYVIKPKFTGVGLAELVDENNRTVKKDQ